MKFKLLERQEGANLVRYSWSPNTWHGWIRYLRIQLGRVILPRDYRSMMEIFEAAQGEIIIGQYKVQND